MRRYIDNSTNIHYPGNMNVNVKETKAPTDESIRLMEEMHQKAMNNIIEKIRVENNLLSGTAYAYQIPYSTTYMNDEIKIVVKFKINNQEFTVEKDVPMREFNFDPEKRRAVLGIEEAMQNKNNLNNYANAILLWFALKKLPQILFEQITGRPIPNYLAENQKIKL